MYQKFITTKKTLVISDYKEFTLVKLAQRDGIDYNFLHPIQVKSINYKISLGIAKVCYLESYQKYGNGCKL
jgi:hypothetical protein